MTPEFQNTRSFYRLLWIGGILSILISIVFLMYVNAEKEINQAHEMRFQAHEIAHELLQTSNDLTRMARTYTVSRNPVYKKAYFDILAIRDGKQKRPTHYDSAYWDIALSSHEHLETYEKPQPLLEKLDSIALTNEEYRLLKAAKIASDNLANIEKKAFLIIDSASGYTEESFHEAIEMLHNDLYHDAKVDVMHPIRDFDQLIEKRTNTLIAHDTQIAFYYRFLLISLVLLLVITFMKIYHSLQMILGTSIRDLHAKITNLETLDSIEDTSRANENTILGWISQLRRQLRATYRQYEESIAQNRQLKELYAALAQCNETIIRTDHAENLYPKICHNAVTHGQMKMAWIGIVDHESNTLVPRYWAGEGTEYLKTLSISLDQNQSSAHGPSAKAAIEKNPQWVQDFQNDARTVPWHEKGKEFGWKGSAAFPLMVDGTTVAVFNIYTDKVDFFDVPIQNLFAEMISNISFALKAYHQKGEIELSQHALQESYHLLESIIDIAPIRIFWKDKELRYLGCNQQFAKDAGLQSPKELIGKNDFELSWAQQAKLYREDDQNVMESGTAKLFFEEPQTTPDGETIWLSTSKVPLKNSDGETIGILGMYEDITASKMAQFELEKERNAAQNYLNIVGVMILVLDNQKNVVLINQRGCEIMGYTAEEMIGKNWIDNFLPERYRDKVNEVGETLVNKDRKQISYFENPVLTKNGEERLIAWRNSSVIDENGKIMGILTSGEDITEFRASAIALQESEQRLKNIVENEPECVKIVSPEGNLIEMNPAGLQMLEVHSLEEAQSRPLLEYLLPQWRDAFLALHQKVMHGGEGSLEFEIMGVNGTHRWLESHAVPLKNAEGTITSVLALTRDITQRKQTEEQLHKLSQAVEQSPSAVVITDLNGNIEYVNQAFTETTGYTVEEAIGRNPRFLQSSSTSSVVYQEMWNKLLHGQKWVGEFINRHKNGNEYIQSVIVSPIIDSHGKTTHFMAIEEDITEKKRNEERIYFLANFDVLTGLPNRAMMEEHFNYVLSLARRKRNPFALMFIDLDHFKNINDSLGHKVGDELLVELSERLKSVLREEDTLSRQGGDEFILLLPGADAHGSSTIAQKLLEILSEPFHIGTYELTVTLSIGIALYPSDGESMETLSKNADAAMYRAKQEGRNSYRFYTEEMQQRSMRNLELSNALHHAIDNNELYLMYQPQLSASDLRIIGTEALIRWNHPAFGPISPAEFIPIAEDSGLIIRIGEWVLQTAIKQAKEWMDQGLPPMIMAVNLSAVQFRHPQLPQLITSILNEYQLPPEFLEIELTERMAMHDPEHAIKIMNQLHEQGIRMSIDDFGTGYSSLSYLKKFNVYKLKIDQSFVRDINTDAEDKAIVGAVIDMAKGLDLLTIAEGVETQSQLEFLQQQGCDEIQGYLFSKPLLPEAFETFTRTHQPSSKP